MAGRRWRKSLAGRAARVTGPGMRTGHAHTVAGRIKTRGRRPGDTQGQGHRSGHHGFAGALRVTTLMSRRPATLQPHDLPSINSQILSSSSQRSAPLPPLHSCLSRLNVSRPPCRCNGSRLGRTPVAAPPISTRLPACRPRREAAQIAARPPVGPGMRTHVTRGRRRGTRGDIDQATTVLRAHRARDHFDVIGISSNCVKFPHFDFTVGFCISTGP